MLTKDQDCQSHVFSGGRTVYNRSRDGVYGLDEDATYYRDRRMREETQEETQEETREETMETKNTHTHTQNMEH